jgi:hypothetical protein
MMRYNFLIIVTNFIFFVNLIYARRFHAHDHVGIVANTVGPFNNPTETYPVK